MSTLDGTYNFTGPSVSISGNFYPPVGSIGGNHITADPGNRIPASKVVHHVPICKQLAAENANIGAVTEWLYGAHAGATFSTIEVFIAAAATGDRTASIDFQKSSGGGSFATILSAPMAISSATAIRTAVTAAMSNTTILDGDVFKVVVTVAGSTGTQPQGLLLVIHFDGNPS